MTIQDLKEQNLIIFETLAGSHSYGTNTPESDKDIRGVFILPQNYIFGTKYIEQVNDKKNDIIYYEIKRFLQLLEVNNPNMLELLNAPADCILYQHPIFNHVLDVKNRFITKLCRNSFVGYIKQQAEKAKGMDKMQNWESARINRKTPIDFCYVIQNEKSYPLRQYLKDNDMEQLFCGIVKIPHANGIYALFYDKNAEMCFSEKYTEKDREVMKKYFKTQNKPLGLGYKGFEIENTTSMRLSSVPKGQTPKCMFFYNENGYSMHCTDYNQYQEWIKKRNKSRWTDVQKHGQQIDGKNMLHLTRISEMAVEIASGHGINVRRNNAVDLLKIRKGEVPLQNILDSIDEKVSKISGLFEKSNLPDRVDPEFVNNLLIYIRQQFYLETNQTIIPKPL